jgi:hypothetical protein
LLIVTVRQIALDDVLNLFDSRGLPFHKAIPTQDYVLGQQMPSLRDSVPLEGANTRP